MKKKTSLIDRLIPLQNRMMKTTLELNQLLWDLDPELANKVINNYLTTDTLNTNKMENKYYTPKLKDLYINSEFEYQTDDKKWHKCSDYINEFASGYGGEDSGWDLNKLIDNNKLRVKYLDKEDIEEVLKTRQLKGDNVELNFQVIKSDYEFYEFDYDLDDKIITVERWYQSKLVAAKSGKYNCYTLFHGTIKNKSEFKVLLKQLNIK